MPLLAAATCPDSLLDDVHTQGADRPPTPNDLTYSLTLPASVTSPAIARRAVAAILRRDQYSWEAEGVTARCRSGVV